MPSKGQKYDHHEVGHIIRRACKRAGIKDCSFRGLRPKVATDAMRKYFTIEQLQTGLVHTSKTTTEDYLRGVGAEISSVTLPLPKPRAG